ncbi:SEC14-like protein 2 [Geodia barretti]|uniref:SEC14-like protein 2 n=1 Tax=Geodia barretti TaxID=519541 RepID=A0AA35X2J9_GEOBA|nr:SEC14-like protein 2 [Geodia barretti]
MSSQVEDLTPEQWDALENLKSAVADVEELAGMDDRYFLRWLKARKFHLAKAEDMLRKHIETRKKYKLDTILTDYKPNEVEHPLQENLTDISTIHLLYLQVLEKYFPGGAMGEDRDGHPVWYDNFNYDFKGLHYSVRNEDIVLCTLYRTELMLKLGRDSPAKLREKLKDLEELTDKDDYYFLRFLRIRNFNVNLAQSMIKASLGVRRRLQVDTLLEEYDPPPVLKECFPGGFFGEDREGHPVWYDNFGNLDAKGLYHSVKRDEFMKYKFHQGEQLVKLCEESSARRGKHIETFVMVIDLKNLSLTRQFYWPGIRYIIEVITMLEPNYPDTTGEILLINIPSRGMYNQFFRLVEKFMDDKTRNKITLLCDLDELKKYISPDQLPAAYGGTRYEPDPYCTKYINTGRLVPEEYYFRRELERGEEEAERVHLGVWRNKSHTVSYQVEKPATILKWEIQSLEYDIAFGLTLEDGLNPPLEIVPLSRVNSHLYLVTGSHTCEKTGKCEQK